MALVAAKSLRELEAQLEVLASELEATLKDYARSHTSLCPALMIKLIDAVNAREGIDGERISRMLGYCRTGKRGSRTATRKGYERISAHLKGLRKKPREFSELFRDQEVKLSELKATLKKASSSKAEVNYWQVVGVIEIIWERDRIPTKDINEMMGDCGLGMSFDEHTWREVQRYLNSLEARR